MPCWPWPSRGSAPSPRYNARFWPPLLSSATPPPPRADEPHGAEPEGEPEVTARVRLVLATANPHKVEEIRAILGEVVELLPRPGEVPDVVEDAPTLEGNARLKAVALCEATGEVAVADDTGLEVDALGGAPGVHSARFAGPEHDDTANLAKLLVDLKALGATEPADRRARFRTVALVRYPDGSETIAEGVVEGHITLEARGDGGFGYDPVFVADDGPGETFAEMGADAKNAISHRARAFGALAELLGH
ncbi:MAG: RdgB/HAM1 family non-canonical purine NTP pyrophosphatase [Actinomycetia bacterium]|nr:RdgB/HAM1 family non-canonical purine NTP pyrophosphatase [Actinomycetes bacterium]